MQVEQAVAAAIIAMQTPAGMAEKPDEDDLIAFQTTFPQQQNVEAAGIYVRGRKLSISAVGRFSNADSDHLMAYSKECENFAKIFPGYPQPAFVTFRVSVSL